MAPRSLWTGSISFGLVNVPVRIYSAIDEKKLHFHLLDRRNDAAIGYEKVNKNTGRRVPDDEIVKAFEYSKGKYVYMEDEDFEAVRVEGYKTIDITDFVPYEDIDPIFFAKTYYVGPDEGAEHVYSLLGRAMEDSGLAAVAKFVMREQQHLGVLRVREGVIVLEQLYFADEIRPVGEIKARKQKVDKRELEMAARLIDSFSGKWDPSKYKDTYRNELLAVVKAKQKGKQVHAEAERVEEPELPDLMTALRESVQRSRAGKRRRASSSRGGTRRRAAPSRSRSSK
jgi:DNA end-binding protein Ku